MAVELKRTVCNRDCPDACSIVAHVDGGKVVKIGGDPEHPVTQGFLCFRTNRFLDRQYSPDRLTRPLLRNGSGELEPVSWDAALDFAAERLTRIRAESGPAAIFHYRSGGSLGALTHLSDHFFEQFGPVTIKRGDICSGAGDAAQRSRSRGRRVHGPSRGGERHSRRRPRAAAIRDRLDGRSACGTIPSSGATWRWCRRAALARRPLRECAEQGPRDGPGRGRRVV